MLYFLVWQHNKPIEPIVPGNNATTTIETNQQHKNATPGIFVQQKHLTGTQKQGLDGFPDGLSLPQKTTIRENYVIDLQSGGTLRIVKFTSGGSLPQTIDFFKRYIENLNFTLTGTAGVSFKTSSTTETATQTKTKTVTSNSIHLTATNNIGTLKINLIKIKHGTAGQVDYVVRK